MSCATAADGCTCSLLRARNSIASGTTERSALTCDGEPDEVVRTEADLAGARGVDDAAAALVFDRTDDFTDGVADASSSRWHSGTSDAFDGDFTEERREDFVDGVASSASPRRLPVGCDDRTDGVCRVCDDRGAEAAERSLTEAGLADADFSDPRSFAEAAERVDMDSVTLGTSDCWSSSAMSDGLDGVFSAADGFTEERRDDFTDGFARCAASRWLSEK